MTITELFTQVAHFSKGRRLRDDGDPGLEIPLPGDRRQVIRGRVELVHGERVGVFSTRVGPALPSMNFQVFLAINGRLRHSRIAIEEDELVLLAFFDPDTISILHCTPMLQEMAAIADLLEQELFIEDRG